MTIQELKSVSSFAELKPAIVHAVEMILRHAMIGERETPETKAYIEALKVARKPFETEFLAYLPGKAFYDLVVETERRINSEVS